ncbi:hypothetical protein VTJ04DRAFT_5692 [Mycothermus thermophilus]|uniref:uncharacterized protein n=1 Tax=Humicola insolens TaxID=85995 RepID=UPI00374217F2
MTPILSLPILGLFALPAIAQTQTTPAQTTPTEMVVTMLNFGWNPEELVGSVIAANPTATTYSIKCPGEQDTCAGFDGPPPDITVVAGPSTAAETRTVTGIDVDGKPIVASHVITCTLTATAPANGPCEYSYWAKGTATGTSFDLAQESRWMTVGPATVTGGFEKLESGTSLLRVPVFVGVLAAGIVALFGMM